MSKDIYSNDFITTKEIDGEFYITLNKNIKAFVISESNNDNFIIKCIKGQYSTCPELLEVKSEQ